MEKKSDNKRLLISEKCSKLLKDKNILKLKKIALTLGISSLVFTTSCSNSEHNKKQKYCQEKQIAGLDYKMLNKDFKAKTALSSLAINENQFNTTSSSQKTNTIATPFNTPEINKKQQEQEYKEKVLNNYKKCKSVKDVLKRKKELEKLHLTKKDKLYKKCKLSPELQRFIYEQSVMNELPTDYTFAIIHTETRGGFESSGEESYNSPGNYDLGLTQQNCVYSVKDTFCKKFKINYDKAYKLVKNNDFVNILSYFAELDEIKAQHKEFDATEYAGCYNGWLNWKNKPISRQYVSIFNKAYNNTYTKYHEIEKIKKKTKKK